MALDVTYNDINTLTGFAFVAGSTYTIKFTFLDQNGNPIDISNATVRWRLAPYGTNFTQIDKTASIIATNVASVLLGASDTTNLSGKFTHQIIITYASGLVLISAQGVITLIKGLDYNYGNLVTRT